jgi:hypothetical protein
MKNRHSRRHLIFISHSSKDTWVAKQIAGRIIDAGAEVFLDEAEIEVGEDFDQKILEFLDRADEMLVLITPWALQRPYVWAELGAAWGRRILIVGVLHGLTPADLQKRDGVPIFLKKRNLIDINSIDTYFQEVRRRVNVQKKMKKRGKER